MERGTLAGGGAVCTVDSRFLVVVDGGWMQCCVHPVVRGKASAVQAKGTFRAQSERRAQRAHWGDAGGPGQGPRGRGRVNEPTNDECTAQAARRWAGSRPRVQGTRSKGEGLI